ncbi:MAG: hypothetical protein ACTSWY_07820 [Promethearchaeota archaeon]
MAIRYPNGIYQILGRAGGGLPEKMRAELWPKFTRAKSPGFVLATRHSRAFKMVKPEIIAQINYLDISTHHIRGEPVMQNMIKYDEEKNEWESLRPVPFMKLISPRFNMDNPIRDDKTIGSQDVRISQVTNLVEIEPVDSTEKVELPKSEVMGRYVFRKKDMLKKFFIRKTNKRKADVSYPDFVVYYTDYSANRKSPLNRSEI